MKKKELKNEALIAFTARQLNFSHQKKSQPWKKAHSSYSTAPSNTINPKVYLTLTLTKAIKSAVLNTCWSSSKQIHCLIYFRTLANKLTQWCSCSPVIVFCVAGSVPSELLALYRHLWGGSENCGCWEWGLGGEIARQRLICHISLRCGT